ncbi:MAG: hypothetical protein AABW50_03270 [Nanoarchaeota archaeon]
MLTEILRNVRRVLSNKPKLENPDSIYETLIFGLEEMDKQGVDRSVVDVSECEPDPNAMGRWLNESDFNYYPFGILNDEERNMILGKKSYYSIALVKKNVAGLVNYSEQGVETYRRTHIVPMLPEIKPESNLNYVSNEGVISGDNLRNYAETLSENQITSQNLRERINNGIQEYKNITSELMEKEGVNERIKEMNERKYTPFEEIMTEMRENIQKSERGYK